ncbi:MAG TPA: glycosyltransferase [Gaiellaceae bacterium]
MSARAVPAGSERRLCMVVHGPYPLGESRVAREAGAAVAAGWEVDVVAMKMDDEPSHEIVDGVAVHRIRALRGSRSGFRALVREYFGFTLLATLRTARLHLGRRYSVVQVHNPPDFLLIAGLLPRLLGACLVFDVHDFAPELFLLRHPHAHSTRLLKLLESIERFAGRSADAVVTVHEPYRRALVEKGVPSERVTVVLNSLDESLLPDEPVARDPRFLVMHHGTMNEHYGIDVLIRAYASLRQNVPTAELEFYGTGTVVPDALRLVRSLGLGEHVRLEGIVLSQRDVLRQVPRASVGVVANLAVERNLAVLPVKLLEYVALRTPVVASDLPGIREYFDDDEILYYPAGDVGALAEALESVARNPRAAELRAEAALGRYSAYRWHVYAARYSELLDNLVRARKGSEELIAAR